MPACAIFGAIPCCKALSEMIVQPATGGLTARRDAGTCCVKLCCTVGCVYTSSVASYLLSVSSFSFLAVKDKLTIEGFIDCCIGVKHFWRWYVLLGG